MRSWGSISSTARKNPQGLFTVSRLEGNNAHVGNYLCILRLQRERFPQPLSALRQLPELHEADCQLVQEVGVRRPRESALRKASLPSA